MSDKEHNAELALVDSMLDEEQEQTGDRCASCGGVLVQGLGTVACRDCGMEIKQEK